MSMRRYVCILALSILFFYPFNDSLSHSAESPDYTIRIVYNNIPGDPSSELTVAGGFSAWIEFNDRAVLFDAGGESTILVRNLLLLNLDLKKLDAIFISHNHNDHVYGLPILLGMTRYSPKVYVPLSSRDAILEQNPRANIVPIDKPEQLYPDIWSTGQIKVKYLNTVISEQALVIGKSEGICIIAGCSHPGIVELIEESKKLFPEKPIILVAGGFHLRDHTDEEIREISLRFKELGVKNIGPSHCTGENAIKIFKEEWKDNFIRLYLGDEYKF